MRFSSSAAAGSGLGRMDATPAPPPRPPAAPTVPVTVLSGFLGAGKTTMLNHILNDDSHRRRIAVVVNDMAAINIDADLVGGTTGAFRAGDLPGSQEMVELSNGCICCTLREDLMVEVSNLASKGGVDHIVVESTGVSEPLPVAQTFSSEMQSLVNAGPQNPENAQASQALVPLDSVAHLHCLVTVVDCSTFLSRLKSIDDLKTLGMQTGPDDVRPLGKLLIDQCQFANIIVLNKIDLASDADIDLVESLIKEINPGARIMRTEHSKLDVKAFLDEQLYDENEYRSLPAWAEEFNEEHHPESEVYGIQNFSLQRLSRPFHPERWHAALTDGMTFKGVLRGKGCFWIASQPNERFDFSLVGSTMTVIKNTVWVDVGIRLMMDPSFRFRNEKDLQAVAGNERHTDEARRKIKNQMTRHALSLQERGLWDEKTKDRRVELIFIGDSEMDQEKITNVLENALLTDEEFDSFMAGKDVCGKDPFSGVPSCMTL